jgi:hypothetical protein
MNTKKFNGVRRQKEVKKFYANKPEAYDLARRFRELYPELTNTQALASAYIMSGRSILEAKLKIEK